MILFTSLKENPFEIGYRERDRKQTRGVIGASPTCPGSAMSANIFTVHTEMLQHYHKLPSRLYD